MSALSDYWKREIADHTMNGLDAPSIPILWIALTTTGQDSANSASADEPAGGSYARVGVANGFTWGLPNMANSNVITFPQATASWGTLVSWSAYDSGTVGAGNLILFGDLDAPKLIDNLDTFEFDAGNLVVSWN